MKKLLLSCLVLLTCIIASRAQVDQASVFGTVKDQNGAIVAGAKILITSEANGFRRDKIADDEGRFTLSALPIGNYNVSIEQSGFAPEKKEIVLRIGENRKLDFVLKLTGVAETVDIVDSAPPVDTSSFTGGTVIEQTQIKTLPLNGRHWSSLMALAPGAVNTGSGSQNSIRFNGRGRDENYWTLDGVDQTGVKDPRQEENLRLVVSTESIAEFRVNTQLFSADQGTASGAVINIVSKSGTNSFNGSVFHYIRNDKLNARAFNDTLSSQAPPFKLNQFGGSFGGPIAKDRAFFFASYEGLRQRRALTLTDLVPSDAFRAQVAASTFAASLTPILNIFPTGGTPVNANTNLLNRTVKNTLNENNFNFRTDFRLNERRSMFFRGVINKANANFYNRGDGINQRTFDFLPSNYAVQYQEVFTPTFINETRFGYNNSPLERTDGNLALADGPRIDGFTRLRPTVDQFEKGTSFSILNNSTWVAGNHTLKFGSEFRFLQIDVSETAVLELRFRSAALFLQNRVDNFSLNTNQELQETRRNFYLPYFQDDWRILPNLTLNLGLRYEYYTVAKEKNGNGRVWEFACGGYCPRGTRWYQPDKNNLAPRLGFAYGLFGGKTTLRGGYGIFYSPGQNDDVNNPIDNERDRFSLSTSTALPLSYPVTPFIANGVALQAPRALQPDRRDMYSHNYSFSIVQQLPLGLTAVIGYNGSKGKNLFSRTYYNTIDPVTLVRQLPTFAEIDTKENRGKSSFDAMQLSLYRRVGKGLTFGSEYMLSEGTSTFPGAGESGYPQDVRNFNAERGTTDFDIRQVSTSYFTYQLPFGKGNSYLNEGAMAAIFGGWELSGIISLTSGRPINVTISRSTNDLPDRNPNSVQRPDIISVNSLAGIRNGSSGFFNPGAFTIPAIGTYGNAPRNLLRGPGLAQFDTSVSRRINFSERFGVDLRMDVFNLFNRTQYANPSGFLGTVSGSGASRTLTVDPLFGVSTSSLSQDVGVGTPRSLQFSVRFGF